MEAIYDRIGIGYKNLRQPDPRIAATINRALGDATSILNVGAGAGSYEPRDQQVIALEPSRAMIHQRPTNSAPVVQAAAENLPFPDNSFAATLAILTIHHWRDRQRGIREMLRVARDRVVILTFDPAETCKFWLVQDYFPEIADIDFDSLPALDNFVDEINDSQNKQAKIKSVAVSTVPVPKDCSDGFLGAYWQRPHAYLEQAVRNAISAFDKVINLQQGIHKLESDLISGEWLRKYGSLGKAQQWDVGYRIIVAEKAN